MNQEMNEVVTEGVFNKYLTGVYTLEYTMNTLMIVGHILRNHPSDEMLLDTKKRGELIKIQLVEELSNLGSFILDKFFDDFKQEDKELFLRSSEVLANIVINSDTEVKTDVSIQPTSNKVH